MLSITTMFGFPAFLHVLTYLILKENIVNTLDAFVTSLSVSCHCIFDLQPEDAVRGLS